MSERYATTCDRCGRTVLVVMRTRASLAEPETITLQEAPSRPFRLDYRCDAVPTAIPQVGVYVEHEPLCPGDQGDISR